MGDRVSAYSLETPTLTLATDGAATAAAAAAAAAAAGWYFCRV